MSTTDPRTDIVVLGGSGVVGRALTRLLAPIASDVGQSLRVIAASRRCPTTLPPGVVPLAVDASDDPTLGGRLRKARVVIDASGLEDRGQLAAAAADAGAHLVDLSADHAHLESLVGLDKIARHAGSTVLTEVGLASGLTNLLAAAVRSAAPESTKLDLDLVLGLGEHHGPAATRWMLAQLATPSRYPDRRVTLPAGFGRRTLRWVDFAEQHTLARDLGIAVVSQVALDPAVLGRLTRHAARIPALLPTLAASARAVPALTARDGWLAAATASDGTTAWATGRHQSIATAVIAAWATRWLLTTDPKPGVHPLHRTVALDDILGWLSRHDIAAVTPSRTGVPVEERSA